jgi:5,5'-dehydrodivanillate O-demethylase
MRRYWHVVATAGELAHNPTKAVRVLGESLVLYRDRSGHLGLIGEACAHRRVNLLYGIPEQHGLRCPYHGWLYNEKGQCLEQPAEAPDSTFKERIKIPAYPVQELGGLIWAYLGPEPAPLLPRWDLLVREDLVRDVGVTVIPCNWLQCMENSMDPVHTEWLHAYLTRYLMDRRGEAVAKTADGRYIVQRHTKIGFDLFEHGIYKRRLLEGQSEENDDWRSGHPVIFPTILKNTGGPQGGGTFQIRVPMDDTHTWHLLYRCAVAESGAPRQEEVRAYDLPLADEQGRFRLDISLVQDFMAWVTQGEIADRPLEKLGESDKGIILFRRLLKEQLAIVEDGGDPMNVFRDPARNVCVEVATERRQYQSFPLGTDVSLAGTGARGR